MKSPFGDGRGILRAILPLALVCLGALALRLWGLTRQSLWEDELFSVKYAGIDAPLTWGGLRVNLHGPLHAAFLYLWCSLFGWSELALRLPQALVSAASVAVLFRVARPVFGEGRALAGAIALAINPFHIWYAQEVRNYAFVMLFTLLAIGAIQRLDRTGRFASVPALAASWVGGLLCNLSFVSHIVAAGLWGLNRFWRRREALVSLVISGVLTAVALLPWGIGFYRNRVASSYLLKLEAVPEEERLRGEATAPVLGIPYAAYAFSVGYSLGPSIRELRRAPTMEALAGHPIAIASTAVCFGVLAVAGLASWLRRDGGRRLWLLALLLPLLLAFFGATRNVKVFNPRYAAAALPAYVMLLVEGAAALRPRTIGLLVAGGAVVLSGMSCIQLQTQPRYWKEDARAATRVLKGELAAGDLIIVVGTWDPLYRYYWREVREEAGIRRYIVPHRIGPEVEGKGEEALGAIRSARRTYVLFYRDDFDDPAGKWEAFLKSRFPIEQTWEFPGVRIWRLGAGETTA